MVATHTILTVDVSAYAELLQWQVDKIEADQVNESHVETLGQFDRGLLAGLRMVLADLSSMSDPASSAHAAYVR